MKSEKQRLHLEKLANSRIGSHITEEHKKKIGDANRGRVSQLKGRKIPIESRIKMSVAKKGKPTWAKGKKFSEVHRAHISSAHADVSGSNNPNWRGGLTYTARLFRKSGAYKSWRKKILERDNYRCILCGSTDRLEVDHIKSFALFPDLRIEMSNGRTLCKDCHVKTPSYGRMIPCA